MKSGLYSDWLQLLILDAANARIASSEILSGQCIEWGVNLLLAPGLYMSLEADMSCVS